ncbi:hypothetical protein BDB00DRAFT_968762, partial [Zychaea mexicana]|uniref:uncharacterized protein n=1 Tax=Zychaea mexicana TaxID=64656 RepID=UPI0022FF1C16
MHRPRGRSVSQIQDEEIPSIEAQHDYVNRVLKWSISDLERFINLLKGRVYAEEAYVQHLSKINRAHAMAETDMFNCFGNSETTFRRATLHYERSIDQTIVVRKNLIRSMWSEIDKLVHVKEAQEARRKKVKARLAEENANYITYRTREVPKLHKSYMHRCMELQGAQEQLQLQQQQQQGGFSPMSNHGSDLDLRDGGESTTRLSADEPRPRLSADNDSLSSLEKDTTLRKGMQSFMAQMRTQIANATAAASVQDVSKQNAKCARLGTEIIAADLEYRTGIRVLERLRKKQIETAAKALKQVETVFTDKTNVTKSAMGELLNKERSTLADETRIADFTARSVEEIDGQKDIYLFTTEYQKKRYITPSRIYYENYYHGKSKDLAFGTSLDEYAAEYNRTVPLVVSKCIEAVERMGGLQKEGIYRISGRQSNVESLKYLFEKGEQEVNLENSKYDVVTIASVLKIYLRELKQPLFNLSVQTRMEYATLEKQRRLVALQGKLSSLPKIHRDTLHTLIRHLAKVNAQSQVNKMNLQNLSLIFTPAIFHDHNHAEIPGEWRTDCVFEDMMTYYEPLFANAEIQSQNNAAAAAAAAQHQQVQQQQSFHHQQPQQAQQQQQSMYQQQPYLHQQQQHPQHPQQQQQFQQAVGAAPQPQGGLTSAQSSTATLSSSGSSSNVNASTGMLLTQPLHPVNLTSPGPQHQQHPSPQPQQQTSQQDIYRNTPPARMASADAQKQPRSASLNTATPVTATPSSSSTITANNRAVVPAAAAAVPSQQPHDQATPPPRADRRPSQPMIASPDSQFSVDTHHHGHHHTASEMSDAATWIGMAALSGALDSSKSETATMGGGLRGVTAPIDTRPAVITTAPDNSTSSPIASPADDTPTSTRPSSMQAATTTTT